MTEGAGGFSQGACALNGALVCLKLKEWARTVELASLALEIEHARSPGDTGKDGTAEVGGDAVRCGKALFRRASARFQMNKLADALADLRRARAGGLATDVGVQVIRVGDGEIRAGDVLTCSCMCARA